MNLPEKLPTLTVPTTAKEFIRWTAAFFGAATAEAWFGAVSYWFPVLKMNAEIPWWAPTGLFLLLLLAFFLVDGAQRTGHLEEQAQVATKALLVGSKPPPQP